jgi:alpha-galactosidase
MKTHKLIYLAALLAWPACLPAQHNISDGAWNITFDESAKTLTYAQNGMQLVTGAYVEIHDAVGKSLLSTDYPTVTLTDETVSDEFGSGTKYTYTYSGLTGKDNIEHNIYVYPDKNYILVEAALVANSGTTKTNYIAPIVSKTANAFLPAGGQNVVYDMPHDNDNWVGYSAYPFGEAMSAPSCEVSGYYDVKGRGGLIVGSIEHDNWKSGITSKTSGTNSLDEICVAAGVVNQRTNDIRFGDNASIMPHGSISGAKVRSPRYFFGYYDDWRDGFEALGDATATLAPKQPWNNGTIFAWQSWGGMAEHVNWAGANNVSLFFQEQLMPNNFVNENGVCYMVLDSYWDNLTDFQLKLFATQCKERGQVPGIYHSPFSCWLGEEDAAKYSPYDGSPYTWADISLRANGKLEKIQSIALDPTHPGTIEYNRKRFQKFKELGFEYIKLDFINNGTLEADSYYDKSITTGMQAYNYGMKKILEMADGMFVDLSIAPVFPAMGHARRISCDSWGELDNSMYTLNSLELGWWLDRVYQYNDPDHLVLSRAKTDGEARIRYTCGAMTGTVLLGDNYSLEGSYQGTQAERDLAMRIATNADINSVARIGRSFRPVEGGLEVQFYRYQYSYGVDREFVLDTDNALYYAVFNYDEENDFTKTADFSRIGVEPGNVKSIKELWTGEQVSFSGNGFSVSVPKGDVRMYRIDKNASGIDDIVSATDGDDVTMTYAGGRLAVKAQEAVTSVQVYDMQGVLMSQVSLDGDNTEATVGLDCANGLYIAKATMKSGRSAVRKIMVK